ncbi:putative conserved secreted protein [Synechococcus sp. RS9909]|uniref:hypothetical protein n=1 Tax=unclassified Synechococcus TaxID=2626047 RepID=UPI00006908A0|nr:MULTISPECIES: hypothetical protein [unclassified Synechococcus]EAQ68588.1 Proline-rich region [Synechococcus sp. RS9917]QNI78502.1 putative conserved secreted protein [Synechococcus sp. RS9909]
MGAPALRRLMTVLLCACITLSWTRPVSALSLPWSKTTGGDGATPMIPAASGTLQEVAAPGAVQQLQRRLDGRRPRLSLVSPPDGAVLREASWTLTLQIEDWPVTADPDLGPGAHIALQIDGEPPQRFSHLSDGRIQVTLPALSPGSHRLTAYAATPWGEAVKLPGASLQWRLHQIQALPNTQPGPEDPWLVLVSPSELSQGQPLLLDWLVWNAPLQNLREGDGRWRLRLTLNGDSVLLDQQQALWLQTRGRGTQAVQMELLDELGEPITPVFNNQLRATPQSSEQAPIWLQDHLSDNQLARLLGETPAPAEPKPEPEPEPEAKSDPEPEPDVETEPALGMEPEPEMAHEDAPETEEEAKADSSAAPLQRAEPPPRLPTTSLGGSARELLNPDGTQR